MMPAIPKPPALPPVTAEFSSALQLPKTPGPPVQSASRLFRASDGRTRTDSGNQSVISNPATGQTIMLDHIKKTATIQPPAPPAPAAPGMPQMPKFAIPGAPAMPMQPPTIQNLGKSVMQGHEVEGVKFQIPQPQLPAPAVPKPPGLQLPGAPKPPQPPKLPQAAGMPQLPKPPQLPGMPKLPKPPAPPQFLHAPQVPGAPPPPAPPGAPAPPKPPTVGEVWTAPKLGIPMLTKVNGSFGQLTQTCQKAVPGEPNPKAFQIPPGYNVITLPPPPKPPAPPALPKLG